MSFMPSCKMKCKKACFAYDPSLQLQTQRTAVTVNTQKLIEISLNLNGVLISAIITCDFFDKDAWIHKEAHNITANMIQIGTRKPLPGDEVHSLSALQRCTALLMKSELLQSPLPQHRKLQLKVLSYTVRSVVTISFVTNSALHFTFGNNPTFSTFNSYFL